LARAMSSASPCAAKRATPLVSGGLRGKAALGSARRAWISSGSASQRVTCGAASGQRSAQRLREWREHMP
jgi:hypothetical protein